MYVCVCVYMYVCCNNTKIYYISHFLKMWFIWFLFPSNTRIVSYNGHDFIRGLWSCGASEFMQLTGKGNSWHFILTVFSAIWTKTHYSIRPEQCLNVRCQISVRTERKKYVLAKSYPVIFSTFRRATSKNERNVHNSQVPIYVYGYIWVKSRIIWLFDVLLICSTDSGTW